MPEVKVQIYIDTGVIFQYVVEAETKKKLNAKLKRHHDKIAAEGYQSATSGTLTTWPPHRIDKIKSESDVVISHEDEVTGT